MKRRWTALFVLAVAVIVAACGGDGSGPSATSTVSPAAEATFVLDSESPFPVVLEHDTLIVVSADGSEITETPLKPGDRAIFGPSPVAPNGQRRVIFRDGTLLIQEGDSEPVPILEIPSAANYLYFTWSPDSSHVLFSASFDESRSGVFVINVDGSGLTELSEELGENAIHHAWSADGAHVAFGVFPSQGGAAQLYVARADGTERTLLGEYFPPQGDAGWDPPAWSRDGARIVAVSGGGLRIFDTAGGIFRDIPETSTLKFSWSPDGRFLASIAGTREPAL